MTLRIPAKVLIHVWSYDFYDMTLSTGKQRRHMIKCCTVITDKKLFYPIFLQTLKQSVRRLQNYGMSYRQMKKRFV